MFTSKHKYINLKQGQISLTKLTGNLKNINIQCGQGCVETDILQCKLQVDYLYQES